MSIAVLFCLSHSRGIILPIEGLYFANWRTLFCKSKEFILQIYILKFANKKTLFCQCCPAERKKIVLSNRIFAFRHCWPCGVWCCSVQQTVALPRRDRKILISALTQSTAESVDCCGKCEWALTLTLFASKRVTSRLWRLWPTFKDAIQLKLDNRLLEWHFWGFLK